MGALLERVLMPLLERVAVKLAAVLALLAAALKEMRVGDIVDGLLTAVSKLVVHSEPAQQVLRGWLSVVWQALSVYWAGLLMTCALAAGVAAAGHLPLLWRALTARRRRVFISFQHAREAEAGELAAALDGERFNVLRVPFDAATVHQGVVITVNDLLRRAEALVCLPGTSTSFVDAEVAAATVARKPVVFVVPAGGALPNTADKQYPTFNSDRAARERYGPVAQFLHFVTQDLQSARGIYAQAWRHPSVLTTLPYSLLLLVFVSLAIFIASAIHGHMATAAMPTAVAGPDAASLRVTAVWLMAIALLVGALVLLPVAAWCARVALSLAQQLRAAKRAALRVRTGEFTRADWQSVIPGMQPGEALYESMEASAPMAHHELAVLAGSASPLER